MENYKEKYEKALKVASQWHKDGIGDVKTIVECIFPELRESEDERIRKELIERFNWELKGAEEQDAAGCSRQKDIAMFKRGLAWLEKQGEQKPAWSEEDESMFLMCSDAIAAACAAAYYTTEEMNKMQNWLKSLKPNHWKPSEQNIKDSEWCADLVKDKMGVGFHRLQVFIDEIKNL